MESKKYIFLLFLVFISIITKTNGANVRVNDNEVEISKMSSSAFDDELYIDVLNEVQCTEQLQFLSSNSLALQFLDASGKFPSGFLTGNINDLGDYYQCLAIDQHVDNMSIQGKYCMISLDLSGMSLPALSEIPWPSSDNDTDDDDNYNTKKLYNAYESLQQAAHIATGLNPDSNSRMGPSTSSRRGPSFAVCIPKVCSWNQISTFIQQTLSINGTSEELYCRLPNDKPFVAADYVAFVILGGILLITAASTSYDLYFTEVLKQKSSPRFSTFSIYTNTKRFLTFNAIPGALECIDGIRAISMLWIIVGHTYMYTARGSVHNLAYILDWSRDITSVWISSAPITVDTFFLLSGILCVYSTIGKVSRSRFARSVHLFYLNRLLRMFPLLAIVVLLEASLFNHVSDGPNWNNVALGAENCRRYWWAALLHVQNYVNPSETCVGQTWYLSVDVQLYIFCPLILIFMFGSRRIGWSAVIFIFLLSLVSTSLYSFTYNFPAALASVNRLGQLQNYMNKYYVNTLTRAPPFFVGMACGYQLHFWKDKSIRIPKIYVAILWVTAFTLMAFCIFSMYPVMQVDHDAQIFDNLLNAYMRTIWAFSVSWMIIACVKGYGGHINWFLSHGMWKLVARMSYAMYLLHCSIIIIANSSWVKTHYFTNGDTMYRFGSDVVLTFIVAFVLSILIDAPFSTLQKMLLQKGKKQPVKAES